MVGARILPCGVGAVGGVRHENNRPCFDIAFLLSIRPSPRVEVEQPNPHRGSRYFALRAHGSHVRTIRANGLGARFAVWERRAVGRDRHENNRST